MAEVKMTFDGVPFSVADDTAQAIVNRIISARDTAQNLADQSAASLVTMTADRDRLAGEVAALTAKLADAEITPAKLQAMVDARASVIATAKRIAPAVVTDGKTDAEIRKAAVVARLGDAAAALNDDAIAGAFTALVPTADAKGDNIALVISDGATVLDAKAEYDKARANRLARLRGEEAAA